MVLAAPLHGRLGTKKLAVSVGPGLSEDGKQVHNGSTMHSSCQQGLRHVPSRQVAAVVMCVYRMSR